MGGVKKKPISAAEKAQRVAAEERMAKKAREAKASQSAKQSTIFMPKMSDEQLIQTLMPLKAITIYGAAKALGVKASVATSILRSLEGKKLLRRVGGYSGHYVYAVAS